MNNRSILLLALFCAIGTATYCQKTELRINAYTGFFFFRGNGSSSSATVYYSDLFKYGNGQPFGRRSVYAYIFEAQLQRVTPNKHLYGLGVSWEELKSNTWVDSAKRVVVPNRRKDKITVETAFLTINPYIGHRFSTGSFIFDLQAGTDLSLCTKVQESVQYYSSAESRYEPYHQGNIKKPVADIRPRMQVNAYYNRIGLAAGYSMGLTNFQSSETGFGNSKAYTNILRLGLSYRLM